MLTLLDTNRNSQRFKLVVIADLYKQTIQTCAVLQHRGKKKNL